MLGNSSETTWCVCVCVCVLCASEVKMYVHNIPFRLGLAASALQPFNRKF